ncbi:MAG TPA: hypothetical protein DCS55_23760 [Acidimicrobiaceae bacterium]|nr:hypothetical protein [Acidimicrobiaceae bacterium]
MGKASSNKKVARAAKAGGGRARAAGERNILFPSMLAVVVVLGTLLVVYARDERSAEALAAPLSNEDHWHAAYGVYVCDDLVPDLPEFTAPQNGGNHTHGDGLFHIHPFSPARAGENATLVNWFEDAGAVLGGGEQLEDDRLGVPGGETYVEGESSCDGVEGDPIVQVAVWDTAFAAAQDEEPDRVVTEDFGSIRFEDDGMAFTIAFAPEGADLPAPTSLEDLAGVGSDLGVDPADVPEDTPPEPGDESTTETEGTIEHGETEGDETTSSSALAPEPDS